VPDQQTKQTCAEEAGSNPAEQSAAEQAGRIPVWPMGAAHAGDARTDIVAAGYIVPSPGITFKGFADDLL
jgi:hypothetical protein